MSPRTSATQTRTPWFIGVAGLTVSVFGVLLVWALVSAPFSLGDEPRHFNSVLRLMQGGGWPEPRTAPMLEGTIVASREAGHPLVGAALKEPVAADERSIVGEMSGAVAGEIDWMTQHPPFYYAVVAGIMKAAGGDGWRWDELLMGMRIVSAAIVAAAVPFVAAAVRMVTGSAAASLVGAGVILAIPQFFHVGSLVTNDALVVLVGAALIYLCLRALTNPVGLMRMALVAGIVLGLGLVTKGLMLAAVPTVVVVFLVAGLKTRGTVLRRLLPATVSMAVAFMTGGWWWLRNILVLGEVQPSIYGSGREEESVSGYDPWFFVTTAIGRINQTFWGSIRESLDLPAILTTILGLLAIAAIVATIVFARWRGAYLLVLTYPALAAGIFLFHAWEIYWNLGTTPGIQGRYLFGAITLLAIAVGFCWWRFAGSRHSAIPMATGLVLFGGFAIVGAYGWRFTFRTEWGSPHGWQTAVAEMLQSTGWDSVGLATTLTATLLGATALIASFARLAISERRTTEPPGS